MQNGRLSVFLTPIANKVKVGEIIKFDLAIEDDAMPKPLTANIVVKISAAMASPPPNPPTPVPPAPLVDNNGGESKKGKTPGKQPNLILPQYRLLTKDGRQIPGHTTEPWPDDFRDEDGGVIVYMGEDGKVYKINYDNSYHLRYRQGQRGDVARDAVSQKYIIGMRLLLLGIEHALNQSSGSGDDADAKLADMVDEIRRLAAHGAASTVLAVADHLPKIMENTSLQPQVVE